MRGLVFRPDQVNNRVVGEIRSFEGFCVTGDDLASNAVMKFLGRQRPAPGTLQKGQLQALAKKAIRLGVASCGPSPVFPNIASCGGAECILPW
jgi:hypothetical protein